MSLSVEVHHLAQATLYVYPADPGRPRFIVMTIGGRTFMLEGGSTLVRDVERLLACLRPPPPPEDAP